MPLLVLLLLACISLPVQGRTLENPKRYRIVYTVTVNNTSAEMDSLEVWMPYPTEWPSQTDITLEDTVPQSSQTFTDPTHGNHIVYWETDSPPTPGASFTVSQTFVYTAYDESVAVDPDAVGSYDSSSDLYCTYTADEDKIEAGDAEIVAAAASIVGSETNPYEKAHLIYAWVLDHMVYQSYDGFNGALTSLHNGWGECGDYAALFCALLRAAGVPARLVAGWIAETGRSHHVWAEYYLPNYGWVPVDPSCDDGNATWRYFGSVPTSERFISSKGSNIELAAGLVADLFQTFVWRWYGTTGDLTSNCQITVELVATGTAAVFRVNIEGDAYADGSYYGAGFYSGSADIAEWVPVSELAQAGDVLELDPQNPGHYRKARASSSGLVAGVVSTEPGVILGAEDSGSRNGLSASDSGLSMDDPRWSTDGSAPLALVGIVPVKVCDEGGPIHVGDLLVVSSQPGIAMRWDAVGSGSCGLVGKALDAWDGNGIGLIRLLLMR